ncbi:hypothetical protein BAE44_0004693 [Dichanthelium oligosanthes]|uniref:Uncharacterized protein n=1 Tax=Dichanthelium oligosanthes TaxID=888268 RepID=A0A1E5WAL8_9POAL|nr:hypothetical protein BAE44_0004693 [Dichanthelium oligosanthes]
MLVVGHFDLFTCCAISTKLPTCHCLRNVPLRVKIHSKRAALHHDDDPAARHRREPGSVSGGDEGDPRGRHGDTAGAAGAGVRAHAGPPGPVRLRLWPTRRGMPSPRRRRRRAPQAAPRLLPPPHGHALLRAHRQGDGRALRLPRRHGRRLSLEEDHLHRCRPSWRRP